MMLFFKFPILLLFFCLSVSLSGAAQSTQEIRQYNDSLETQIRSYRQNVYNLLARGQHGSVELNYGYETMVFSSYQKDLQQYHSASEVHYLELNEIEGIFLIQHNFDGILEIVSKNNFLLDQRQRIELEDPRELTQAGTAARKNWYNYDSLSHGIGTLVLNQIDGIKEGIQRANYSLETKDFLKVFLDYEIAYLWNAWKWDFESKTKEDNYYAQYQSMDAEAYKSAEIFCVKYPDSEFNGFIKKFILYKNESKKWAFGMDALHLGTIIPNGKMAENVRPAILYGSLGFRMYYEKAFVNIMGGITSMGLRNDVFIDTIWTRGITMFTGDVLLGYRFDLMKKIGITPLAGVRGIINQGPKYQGERATFNTQAPWVFGMELSLNNKTELRNYISPNYGVSKSHEGFALRVMYQNPGYGQVNSELTGGLFTVTLGFNFASFGLK